MSNRSSLPTLFTAFRSAISSIELPEKFTFPFYYEPHPLALIAAKELQEHLLTQTDWTHNFGSDDNKQDNAIGKMFGVLVVKDQSGTLGYLSAFSGKLAESNQHPGFVPPLFDMLNEGSFFLTGMDILNQINDQIEQLERAPALEQARQALAQTQDEATEKVEGFRAQMKAAKKARKVNRENARITMEAKEFVAFNETLRQESLQHQFYFKDLVKHWTERVAQAQEQHDHYQSEIDKLKEERKNRSNALQQLLFAEYRFLNQAGETRSLQDIFKHTALKKPPAGAGECAAPKLLQYAFEHQLQPVTMAEFWWGQSPKSEVRKHGNFYPACRGKCEPILGHMLAGMALDDNPMLSNRNQVQDIPVVYEDEHLLLINKPPEFLSVPGRHIQDSIQWRMKQKYPEATGPMVAHRLDMSTSGLMIIAKTMDVYKFLQRHFMKRTVSKRYEALLDGIVAEDEGTIDLPLRLDIDDRPRQMVCYEHGKAARTHWKVIDRKDGKTRVHFFPITGRTHQLRVHAAHTLGLNAPIIGDDLYGQIGTRLHLHAAAITFKHPVTKEMVSFEVAADF
ncbi:pseudouridine synthase [Lewinella sp. LCG006]|uniref:RluA family pseudouridine synthase n=1 Tax=Lewinella sp. LCG006 TaxID=3231911 RepID=UPI00346137DB